MSQTVFMIRQAMATETMSQKQLVGPVDGSNSPAKKPCLFYKLIVASILQAKKLRIPEKFVRKYGDELSFVATLILPNGRIWLVELKKADHKLWFQTGWHEFVEYCSISVGYFLVFGYEGNSTFNVHIYDLTSSEVKYPCNSLCSSQEPSHDKQCNFHHEKHLEENDSVEIMNCSNPIFSRSKAFDECVDYKRSQFMNSTYGTRTENLCLRKDAHDLQVSIRSTEDKGIQFNESELTRTADEAGLQFSDEAEQRTKRRKQITEPNVDEHVLFGNHKVEEELPITRISSKTFTRRWRAVTTEEKERTIRAAEMFKSDNPFCRVILRPSYVYKGLLLHVPCSFARMYLNGVTGVITLQLPDGKQWFVRCVFNRGSAKLSKGWAEFAWENNLDDGDVCIFELIKKKDIVLKVTIFRVLEEAWPANQPSK